MIPELRFVTACCRWPDDESRRSAIRKSSGAVADWLRVVALADAHRVQGLVAQAVQVAGVPVPDEVRAAFESRGRNVRAMALRQVAETLRLSQALAAAGMGHRVLKGLPLGVVAYGTPTLKHSWDIDLLVEPREAVPAATLLRDLGYTPQEPVRTFDRAEFERWAVTTKELILSSSDGSVAELHWRVSDHPMLLRGLDARTAGCDVGLIGSNAVPTFSVPANLAYLAVHGAFHGWSRLKWLADYAALLQAVAIADNPHLLAAARRYEPGRALDQALLLSSRLFGTPGEGLVREDRSVARLVGLGLDVIEARNPERDIESDSGAMRRVRESQWLLLPNLRYRALMALRWARGSEDRKAIALPRRMQWAYWVIRPFTAALRSMRRRIKA